MGEENRTIKFRCNIYDLIVATEKKSGLSGIVISSADDLDDTVNYLLGIIGASRANISARVDIDIQAQGSSLSGENAIIRIVMSVDGRADNEEDSASCAEVFNSNMRELQSLIKSQGEATTA